MALSVEFFYPDCPCGASGDLNTINQGGGGSRGTEDNKQPWYCLDCESSFHTPAGSLWEGVLALPEPQRKAYIDCDIRGMTPSEHAHGRAITNRTAGGYVTDARVALGRSDPNMSRAAEAD